MPNWLGISCLAVTALLSLFVLGSVIYKFGTFAGMAQSDNEDSEPDDDYVVEYDNVPNPRRAHLLSSPRKYRVN